MLIFHLEREGLMIRSNLGRPVSRKNNYDDDVKHKFIFKQDKIILM
jgi:hypothetical protein